MELYHVLKFPLASNFMKWILTKLTSYKIPYTNIDTESDFFAIYVGSNNATMEDIDDSIMSDWKHFDLSLIYEFNNQIEEYGYRIHKVITKSNRIALRFEKIPNNQEMHDLEIKTRYYISNIISDFLEKINTELNYDKKRELALGLLYYFYFDNVLPILGKSFAKSVLGKLEEFEKDAKFNEFVKKRRVEDVVSELKNNIVDMLAV